MENVVLTVHLILALLLIGIVLLQRSEGGGLGMGGGGGAMSGRAAANALTRLTWVFAIAFIATSITLTIFAASNSVGTSVIDQIRGSAPAPEAPATPVSPLGTDLLPPASSTAPLTPPRADDAPAPSETPTETAPATEPAAPATPAPADQGAAEQAAPQEPADSAEAPASEPSTGIVPQLTYPPAATTPPAETDN